MGTVENTFKNLIDDLLNDIINDNPKEQPIDKKPEYIETEAVDISEEDI